jgi:hypothetical protein
MDNVKKWTCLSMDELLKAAHNRPDWRSISVSWSLIFPNKLNQFENYWDKEII